MKLVIVESPAKAKTIAKYLGDGYTVDASKGHIMDLPQKEMGVDIDNNYKPKYKVLTKDQKQTIERLREKVDKAECVYLATDPDREGEAISWHLQQALKLDPNQKNRITFNEISKTAVNKAIQNPSLVNMDLVNAQQARRVLDRLVGYTVSPVLCRKIQSKLSAGRVQSAALRIIVDREQEIINFKPEEYWNVTALLQKPKNTPDFKCTLQTYDGKKLKIVNKEQCDQVIDKLKNNDYTVSKVKKAVTFSKPLPPFTTSTLQQDAVNKLRMSSSQAMQIAQQLYEGIDIPGMGHVALVTYIRTDSVRVSQQAEQSAREYLLTNYGAKYVPDTPNVYSSKKSAQDAHEAIRPINLQLTPDSLKDKLQANQYKLYKLIYQRFLASQSTRAEYDSVSVEVQCNGYGFVASGKTLRFDGYTAIYSDATKVDKSAEEQEDNVRLPHLEEGDLLKLIELKHEQKFTKPPQRYTEASLIKAMEERGIGRPSTYAATMSTLYKREYVEKEAKALKPTELGMVVTEYLKQHFNDIVDVEFTAEMENKLDSIEENGAVWYKVVDEIFKPLQTEASQAMRQSGAVIADQPTDEVCSVCGAPMVIKSGRFGKYLACTNYPQCNNRRSLKEKAEPKPTDQICEKCGAVMLEREGKFGKYLACSNYPQCKNTKSIAETVAKCPYCGKDVQKKLTRGGKIFFGCTGYPDCNFAVWDIPTGKLCPKCNMPLVYQDKDKTKIKCSNKDCDFVDTVNTEK